MARLFLNLSDDELLKFENARTALGMNRSQYVRYLIGGAKEIRPCSIRHKEIIRRLSSIDKNIKVIAMKDCLSDKDKLKLMTKLEDVIKIFKEGELVVDKTTGK